MSERLNRLKSNTLPARITKLEKQLDQGNSFNRLGSASVRGNRLFSANPYDVEIDSIAGYSPGVYKTITVTFTPSSQVFGNLSFVHRLAYTYTQDMTNGYTLNLAIERLLPVGNTQSWRIYVQPFSSYSTAYLRVKLYFFLIGSGTFTTSVL